jgi:phosphomannomutase/phosphoglucomutase
MTVDPTIFREYDIRGLVDEDLTTEAVELIGRAYAAFARPKGAKRITVGRDCRDHSPRLSEALKRGLVAGGLDVIDVGVVTTPMLYFSIFHFEADGGIQITGSHNPPEYNGLKVCIGTASLHGAEIQELRKIIETNRFSETSPGKIETKDVAGPYAEYASKNIHLGKRRLKVVVDAGNGTAGPFAVPILKQLGVDVVPLYCEMDATFPNHHPDPTVEKNLADLIRRVSAEKADVGIAYDGDADRLGVVDEKGNILWGDQMMILFSRAILADQPGATIVAEVKCSKTLYDDIEKHGGKAIMWKTGHSLIKSKMKETGAALAGEMSGHIFFKHRYFGFDDGIYAGLRLLEILSETDKPMSSLLEDVPKTFTTPEIRVDCPEAMKFRLVAACVEHFKQKHEVIDVDGARILFPDGWGLIRASNTQPLLVLRFEAPTKARLDEIKSYVERELDAVRKAL